MTSRAPLREGWYLMSTRDLEIELAVERDGGAGVPPSNARQLSVEDALAYRNAGNLPDDQGRTLRLVLRLDRAGDVEELQSKRLKYEPDYLAAPVWRTPDSVAVNVVPLRAPGVGNAGDEVGISSEDVGPWWDRPDLRSLEVEWVATGAVGGIVIPAPYRGFVYKTVVELRSAGHPVTVDAIVDSIARWTRASVADEIRSALEEANQGT